MFAIDYSYKREDYLGRHTGQVLRITGKHSRRIQVSFVPFVFFLAVSY